MSFIITLCVGVAQGGPPVWVWSRVDPLCGCGSGCTCMSVGPIQVGELDVIFSGVGPVDSIINEIQR